MIGIHPSLCPGFAMLLQQEDERLFPYSDLTGERFKLDEGDLTISVGINLDKGGLRSEESRFIILNRIEETRQYLDSKYYWFDALNDVRKWVCISLTHQVGREGFHKFKNTRAAIEQAITFSVPKENNIGARPDYVGYVKAWEHVVWHMLDSQWAKNYKSRAMAMAHLMVKGYWV